MVRFCHHRNRPGLPEYATNGWGGKPDGLATLNTAYGTGRSAAKGCEGASGRGSIAEPRYSTHVQCSKRACVA